MSELAKDFIKFVAEVFLLLVMFYIIFGEEGIASNTFQYLTFVEPLLLQNWFSSVLTIGSYAPGEFVASTETTGQAYVINIYTEGDIKYVVVQTPQEYYMQAKFATIEPTPLISKCTISDQDIKLKKNLIQTITVKKTIHEDYCSMTVIV